MVELFGTELVGGVEADSVVVTAGVEVVDIVDVAETDDCRLVVVATDVGVEETAAPAAFSSIVGGWVGVATSLFSSVVFAGGVLVVSLLSLLVSDKASDLTFSLGTGSLAFSEVSLLLSGLSAGACGLVVDEGSSVLVRELLVVVDTLPAVSLLAAGSALLAISLSSL